MASKLLPANGLSPSAVRELVNDLHNHDPSEINHAKSWHSMGRLFHNVPASLSTLFNIIITIIMIIIKYILHVFSLIRVVFSLIRVDFH